MLAMQYEFVLPADYEMQRIRDRIRAKGNLFDNFPGLVFKAFALCDVKTDAPVNRYAPFYVWRDSASALAFLSGPLFAAVSAAFGQPAVSVGPVSATRHLPTAANMKSALRRHAVLEKPADLGGNLSSGTSVGPGAVSWLDAQRWTETVIEFDAPVAEGTGIRYEIEYLARGQDWMSMLAR